MRVVGKPSLLELIYRDVGNIAKPDGNIAADVYTLKTAAAEGVYKSKSDSASLQPGKDPESGSDEFPSPPNLFLNISGGAAPTWELVLIAVIGALLQLGVFVWDGFITKYPKMTLMPESPSYAFPFTIVGTVGITVGAYICAHVVEASTDEDIWEADLKNADSKDAGPKKGPFRVMWLQPTQIVGDQAFGSFAIHGAVNQQVIRTSRKTTHKERLKRFEIWTAVGSMLSVISKLDRRITERWERKKLIHFACRFRPTIYRVPNLSLLLATSMLTLLQTSRNALVRSHCAAHRNWCHGGSEGLDPTETIHGTKD